MQTRADTVSEPHRPLSPGPGSNLSVAWAPLAALAAALVLTVVAYFPGLSGPFVFDDLTNFLVDSSIAVERLDREAVAGVLAPEGEQLRRRPLARLTFALNYVFAGGEFDERAMKLTNIAIHLANGILVFCLFRLVVARLRPRGPASGTIARDFLPLFAAALWLLHPVQLTSVLYVVQRMTSLATLFALAGLCLFLVGRGRLAEGRKGGFGLMAAGVVGGTLLGAACKEIALVTPFLAFLLEGVLFTRSGLGESVRRGLAALYGLAALIPVGAALWMLAARPELVLGLYAMRDFGPVERLLSEPRVLFLYLGLLFYPNVRHFSLFHDHIEPSTGPFDPLTTALAAAGWVGLVALAVVWRRRQPVLALAVGWFLIGHALEASVIGLELAHEHRNYLPSAGVLFALAYYLGRGLESAGLPRLALPVACTVAVVVGFSTWSRAHAWAEPETLAATLVRNHPGSYRAHMALATAHSQAGRDVGLVWQAYQRAARVDPEAVAPLAAMLHIAEALRAESLRARSLRGEAVPAFVRRRASPLTEPLRLEPAWLAAAGAELERGIESRLESHPVTPETTVVLLSLANCAFEGERACRALASGLVRWHGVAIANERILASDRRRLERSREQLERLVEDLAGADELARSEAAP